MRKNTWKYDAHERYHATITFEHEFKGLYSSKGYTNITFHPSIPTTDQVFYRILPPVVNS